MYKSVCTVRTCTCSICLISSMVFESACVSSHIQEKEKVAAAVSTISVLLLICLLQDLSCFLSCQKSNFSPLKQNRNRSDRFVKTEQQYLLLLCAP